MRPLRNDHFDSLGGARIPCLKVIPKSRIQAFPTEVGFAFKGKPSFLRLRRELNRTTDSQAMILYVKLEFWAIISWLTCQVANVVVAVRKTGSGSPPRQQRLLLIIS